MLIIFLESSFCIHDTGILRIRITGVAHIVAVVLAVTDSSNSSNKICRLQSIRCGGAYHENGAISST